MKRLPTVWTGLALAGLALGGGALTPASVQGQQQGQAARAGAQQRAMEGRQELMMRVQRNYERRIAAELELSPEGLQRLREVLVSFREPRGELLRERRRIRMELERVSGASDSDALARQLLDRTRALRARELELQRQEEERLLEFLTPTQLLRLHRARDAFAEQIRRLEAGGPSGTPGRRGVPPEGGAGPGG
jgi:hypothetical protein